MKPATPKTTRIIFDAPPQLKQALQKHCKMKDTSMGRLLRGLIRVYLAKEEQQKNGSLDHTRSADRAFTAPAAAGHSGVSQRV